MAMQGGQQQQQQQQCQHEADDRHHRWVRHLEGVTSPAADLKVLVHDGHLIMKVKDQDVENISLPDDAYTDGTHAKYQRGDLTVEMRRKDPHSPAMVEKRMFNPDRPHAREISVHLANHTETKPPTTMKHDPTGHGEPTPAQAENAEHNDELLRQPGVHVRMPQASLASVVASDMPVLTNPGGALETAGDGETVVPNPNSADTKLHAQHHDEVTGQLGRATIAPPGTVVERGTRDKAVGREYAEYPAGAEEDEAQLTRKSVDYTEEKVGMATRPLEPADFYATATSKDHEPFSTLKPTDPDAEVCDVCRCAQCQCDKLEQGRIPYDLTKQQQKRTGKPHIKNMAKPTTGVNSHEARDYRLHAKPRDEGHARIGFAVPPQDWVGNVPEGVGEVQGPPPDRVKGHSVQVGGREIDRGLLEAKNKSAEKATHFMG